jgi:hypothetical protein
MITLDAITLHPDLLWVDEFNWHPVEQTVQRTITGALIVSTATRVAGRPITLQPEDDSTAWMPAATVTALRNLAVVPGQQMSLTFGGTTRSVIFRHHDGAAIDAIPVVHYSDGADWYRVTLRLMEI